MRTSTRARYARTFEAHVYPVIGHRRIGTLQYTDLVHLVSTWRGLAVSTQRSHIGAVKMIFRAAELDGYIERNPAAGLALPRRAVTRKQIPSLAEARALAEATRSRHTRMAIMFTALTGLRAGEVQGITPGDLDMLRGFVHVRRQYIKHEQGWWYYDDPKTDESTRAVPIPPVLVEDLAAYLARYGTTRVAAPWAERDGRVVAHDLVFPYPITYRIQALSVRLGPRYSAHSLRHTYTALLENAGVPLTTIDEATGHRTPGITLGVYSRPTDQTRQQIRDVTQRAWTESEPGQQRPALQA